MTAHLTVARAALLAAALGGVVHLGALWNGFAFDDAVLIAGDPGIRAWSGLGARLMEPSWPSSGGDVVGAWRPLTTGLWAVVWIASGGSTVAFHLMAILLHAAATALGVVLFARLFPLPVVAVAGAVFAVHPVHVEAVANVAGSAESLAASLALGAAVLHTRNLGPFGPLRALAVGALYGLALLAKEGIATLPLLLVILDAARLDVRLRDLPGYLRERFTVFLTMATVLSLVLVYRMEVLGSVVSTPPPSGGQLLLEISRVWTVFSIWPEYARLLFFPVELSAEYGAAVLEVAVGWTGAAILGAALGLSTFVAAWAVWRERSAPGREVAARVVAVSLLWVAAALLPVAHILYVAPIFVAERTLYVASWGAALVIGWGIVELAAQRRLFGIALGVVVVLAGAARTAARVPDWRDTDTIFAALARTHPEAGKGWLYEASRLTDAGRAEEALLAYRYAMGILGSAYGVRVRVGTHLAEMGRTEAATVVLRRAWQDVPSHHSAPSSLALAELSAGRPERALPPARAAAILAPDNPSTFSVLARVMAARGDWPGAIEARRATLTKGFSDRATTWMLLAADYAEFGDTAQAIAVADSAELRVETPEESASLSELRRRLGT